MCVQEGLKGDHSTCHPGYQLQYQSSTPNQKDEGEGGGGTFGQSAGTPRGSIALGQTTTKLACLSLEATYRANGKKLLGWSSTFWNFCLHLRTRAGSGPSPFWQCKPIPLAVTTATTTAALCPRPTTATKLCTRFSFHLTYRAQLQRVQREEDKGGTRNKLPPVPSLPFACERWVF